MKKVLLIILSLFFSAVVYAQSTCNSTWPYLYQDFQEGTVVMLNGRAKSDKLNVHLLKGRLHFIDEKGIIRELSAANLLKVQIGNTEFVYTGAGLLKILVVKGSTYIGASYLADLASINQTGGAYNTSSSTLATQKISSIATNAVNTSLMEIASHKTEGTNIAIKTTYFIVSGQQILKAEKKDVQESLSESRQSDFKAFLKKNKINWKDPSDLELVLDFLQQ